MKKVLGWYFPENESHPNYIDYLDQLGPEEMHFLNDFGFLFNGEAKRVTSFPVTEALKVEANKVRTARRNDSGSLSPVLKRFLIGKKKEKKRV